MLLSSSSNLAVALDEHDNVLIQFVFKFGDIIKLVYTSIRPIGFLQQSKPIIYYTLDLHLIMYTVFQKKHGTTFRLITF